jgi:hypothetical protein
MVPYILGNRTTVLVMLILFNHHLVTYRVGVGNGCCIFPVVILNDDFLSSFLYVLPIGFEPYVVNSIAVVHQLQGCCAHGGVDGSLHGECYCTYDASPASASQVDPAFAQCSV